MESLLDDDWLCFYNVPVGKRRRYPDFILVHPQRGLLFLEVKDWKLSSINRIDHDSVELETASGLKATVNPVKQAREGALHTIDMLQCDPNLKEKQGQYKGKLICPYGYGVVLTNITRKQIQSVAPDDVSERVLPSRLLICQDEMLEDTDPDAFQERLWGMFEYRFKKPLTLPDLNRFQQRGIPFQSLHTPARRKRYNPQGDEVVLLTRHSSKGLEFSSVILVGLGQLRAEPENVADESRLLYVAMTRARECLLITASETNVYTQKIEPETRGGP